MAPSDRWRWGSPLPAILAGDFSEVTLRQLLLDYVLTAALGLVGLEAGRAIVRVRRPASASTDRVLLALSVTVLGLLLAFFGSALVDLSLGRNWELYPDQPRLLIVGGFVGALLGTLAAFDSLSGRVPQLVDRLGSPDPSTIERRRGWMRVGLLSVSVLGAVTLLVLLEGERAVGPNPPEESGPPEATVLGLLSDAAPEAAAVAIDLVPITEPSALEMPVLLAAPPNDDRLYVAELAGRIRVIDDGDLREEPFLDISDRVLVGADGGFLGLAFHPDYADNGRLFVYYTSLEQTTVLAEYQARPEDARAEDGIQRVILSVDQASSFHQGGMLQFGPDGYLYVGVGNGVPAGDLGDSQNPLSLNGSILRLDVDGAQPYAVPPENSFGSGLEPNAVWLYGLRNPYRFWIDAPTKRIFIADPGRQREEEIDVAPLDVAGLNFGWPIMEGFSCYSPFPELEIVAGCDSTGLESPITAYSHQGGGCVIIGGLVYRGSAIPQIDGEFFYSDFCQRFIRSIVYDGETISLKREWVPRQPGWLDPILSFGVDSDGEMYLLTGGEGVVYKFVPADL